MKRSSRSAAVERARGANGVQPLRVDVDRAGRLAVDQGVDGAVAAEHDVDVLRLETQPQARVRAGDDPLGADAPVAVVRERVLRDRRREAVRADRLFGTGFVPDVVRQPRVAEVALRRSADRSASCRPAAGACDAVVAEQPADQRLRLRVLALAEVRVADVALLVDQVLGRPVLVRVVVPGPVVVVLHDRVGDRRAASRRPGRSTSRARTRTPACGRR